jgi:hypothetical protein
MAKVSELLWRCADLKKVITFDVSARDDLNHHGLLRSSTAQGRQPYGGRYQLERHQGHSGAL